MRGRHSSARSRRAARTGLRNDGALVIPGQALNYDVQLHIGESRDSGFAWRPGMTAGPGTPATPTISCINIRPLPQALGQDRAMWYLAMPLTTATFDRPLCP